MFISQVVPLKGMDMPITFFIFLPAERDTDLVVNYAGKSRTQEELLNREM